MPRLPLKQLKRLPVKTRSEKFIGRVRDVVLETEGQSIMQYTVAPSSFSAKTYLIGRDQIIAIQSDAIIVDDMVMTKNEEKLLSQKAGPVRPEPIAMRKDL